MIMYFFFNDTATTEIYTLSLHDALPILLVAPPRDDPLEAEAVGLEDVDVVVVGDLDREVDRKSTRLNSSHANISYAVFCLKKKNFLISPVLGSVAATVYSYAQNISEQYP